MASLTPEQRDHLLSLRPEVARALIDLATTALAPPPSIPPAPVKREETEPPSLNDHTGFPRPTVVLDDDSDVVEQGLVRPGQKLPVPWINGSAGMKGDFYTFRADMGRAVTERRCCICGDPLQALVAIAAANGQRETAAGWGHPRCVALTVAMCPHFNRADAKEWAVVAYLYRGPGVGVEDVAFEDYEPIVDEATAMSRTELLELARTDPWGTTNELAGA